MAKETWKEIFQEAEKTELSEHFLDERLPADATVERYSLLAEEIGPKVTEAEPFSDGDKARLTRS